jgi:2-amino-4-hydroxy-6-hydroxymethyldihydropteridine diphosphokinase
VTVTSVYVAAGSNVEPWVNLPRALETLHKHFAPLRVSHAWRNAAVGFEGEDFINLVVGFETTDRVEEVVARLHEAEAACGRERDAPKWAPRAMDLDILLYGDLVCERPGLHLPRPDLVKRAYMLGPIAEIAPDLRHPTLGLSLGELWQRFDRAAHPMQPVEIGWTPRGP